LRSDQAVLAFEPKVVEPKVYGSELRAMFPGKKWADLTADERREYKRLWKHRNPDLVKASREKPEVKANRKAYAERNREKIRAYQIAVRPKYRARSPEYERRSRLKREYGLTEEQFEEMVRVQKSKCAICCNGDIGRKGDKKLMIDHCHRTGKVRELLCHHCNMLLGHSDDDPILLRKAAQYLERHGNTRGRL